MRIDLDENWAVEGDSFSCNLVRKRIVAAADPAARGIKPKAENVGKVREETVGYYGTLYLALVAYVQKELARPEGVATAAALLDRMDELQAAILDKVGTERFRAGGGPADG